MQIIKIPFSAVMGVWIAERTKIEKDVKQGKQFDIMQAYYDSFRNLWDNSGWKYYDFLDEAHRRGIRPEWFYQQGWWWIQISNHSGREVS